MPAGSVLFWLGGVLHGAGANVTADEWRYGMILTYNLSFLRQEENQHVSMPKRFAYRSRYRPVSGSARTTATASASMTPGPCSERDGCRAP